MKSSLILLLIVIIGCAGYDKFPYAAAGVDISRFSLAKVDEQPIPREALFKLWKEVGLKKCADAQKNHNLTPEQCREKISERHTDCEHLVMASAPATIGEKALSRQLGRQYLECVTPYYFCKGIEIRSEAEARKFCQ